MEPDPALERFFDPVADKLMVAAALIVLVELREWMRSVLIIIGREITISALREWMAQLDSQQNVVSMMGKSKDSRPTVAIPSALRRHLVRHSDTRIAGRIFIWAAAVLTLWSMVLLRKGGLPGRKARKQDRN